MALNEQPTMQIGNETDVIYNNAQEMLPMEIEAVATVAPDDLKDCCPL